MFVKNKCSFAVSLTIILGLGILLVPASFAQTKREVLTNAKIIELVRLGLGEEIIVEKIRQSDCQCDTSSVGLAKLKTAKVPNAIIMAMLNSSPSGAGYSESKPPRKTVGSEDEDSTPPQTKPNANQKIAEGSANLSEMREPGIYLLENGKVTAIEPTIYSGTKASFLGSALTYGIKKSKIRAVVRGKSANLQIKSPRPEFYFIFSREYGNSGATMAGGFAGYAATSPAEFMMVVMNVKDNSREAILGEVGAFSASTGAPDKYVREYSFEKIKPGVYKVVPKADLAPGEYGFYYAGAGGAASKIFDFSVSTR